MLDIIFLSQRDSPNVHARLPGSYIYNTYAKYFSYMKKKTEISRKVRPKWWKFYTRIQSLFFFLLFFISFFSYIICMYNVRTLNRFIRLSPRGKKNSYLNIYCLTLFCIYTQFSLPPSLCLLLHSFSFYI